MANNLRVFNTNSEYQSADLVFPSVSYVVETDKVIYDYTPPVFQGKWKATYSDSHTESADCSASSAIVQNEVNKTDLVSLDIGGCATSLNNHSFNGASSLTSVTIGDNVTFIGGYSFWHCSGLKNVTIGSGVTYIEGGQISPAFGHCSSLESFTIKAVVPPSTGIYLFRWAAGCPIYVPSQSVEAYKAASGWSAFAGRIQAIPE